MSSLKQQTFSNLQVILIDDGSTDDSNQQCIEFIKDDTRFSLYEISHRGASYARNYGLDRATKKYIGFLDIDDWFEPTFSELMINCFQQPNVEIASCRSVPTDRIVKSTNITVPVKHYKPEEFLKLEYLNPDVNVIMCSKLYSKHLFETVRFPEEKLYEDVLTNYKRCRQCSCIADIELPLHNYYTGNDNSITRSPLEIEDLDIITQWEEVRVLAKTDFPELVPILDGYENIRNASDS